MFKPGDRICVVTKDEFGYQWINAVVDLRGQTKTGRVHLRTEPDNVVLLLDADELVKVKVVWSDTRKPVKESP